MAIKITENGNVVYENEPNINRELFPNLKEGGITEEEMEELMESIPDAVSDWLDDHPEATTTVQDGSLTPTKLDSDAPANGEVLSYNNGDFEWVDIDSQIESIEDDITDLKSALINDQNYIHVHWESGAINGNTGQDVASSQRIRTNFFTLQYPYVVIIDPTANGSYNIDVNKYNMDGTFVNVVYNYPVFNGALIGLQFDTLYKYRIVSANTSSSPTLINVPSSNADIIFGCGSISNGSFNRNSTNVATLKSFSVDKPSILELNLPNCSVDLNYYSNGSYVGALKSGDTNNENIYFPLSELYTYRLYIASTSYSDISAKIVDYVVPNQVVGGVNVSTGNIIASTGNKRTNLINAAGYKYVAISCAQNVYCVKYKDGVFTSAPVTSTSTWSPAIQYIGDCDFFILMANGTGEITYTLTNDARLYGKKWCSYGDSITEQQKWQNYLVAKFGLVLSNKGLAGSCVTGDTTSSVTPMTADSRINDIATDTEIITVMGGTNDFDYCTSIGSLAGLQTSYDTSTFIGSVATIVKKLQTRCPNAKIILMSNVNSRGTTGQTSDAQPVSTYGYTPYDFAIAMKQAAEWLSVDYIDTWSCGINQLNRTTYVSDTVHPNNDGGKLIALKAIEHFNSIEV